jgi:hypothetical protein
VTKGALERLTKGRRGSILLSRDPEVKAWAPVAEPERDGAGLDRRRDGGQDLRPQLFEVDLVA